MIDCMNNNNVYLEIQISGNYSNLQVGSTTNITCTVPGIPPEAVLWSDAWSRASTVSPGVLKLSSVDSTLNETEFTCSVNSTNLYRTDERKITVTVKGMYCDIIMSAAVSILFLSQIHMLAVYHSL